MTTTSRGQNGAIVTSFPMRAVEVTPSDTTEYGEGVTVYVGTAGDVAVEPFYGDNELTFSVADGGYVPVVCRRVLATGTTATGIVGLS